MNEHDILTEILKREGWDKYTDHPADKGGPTKWGITLAAWAEYLGRAVTAAEVQTITEAQARVFYRRRYIERPHFDQIKDGRLRELLIDAGVNHGPRHPCKWVQWAAEVKQDGDLGPVSLAAINSAAPLELYLWVLAFRIRLYGRLVSGDPQLQKAGLAGFRLQAVFAAGWNNRAAGFIETAARDIEAAHKAAGG